MKKNFKIYINEILNAILEIEEFTGNLTYESFLRNKMAIKAVSMNLVLIGENVKLIPPEVKDSLGQNEICKKPPSSRIS
jgi:uncharacterized protein with HEPN domain